MPADTTLLTSAELAFWNREKAHPFRWTFTGYPLQSGIKFKKAS